MSTSPAVRAMYCNSCGAANASSSRTCGQCQRPFLEFILPLTTSNGPSGFGGWLMWFCVGTCILTPAWFANAYLHPPIHLYRLMLVSGIAVLLGMIAGAMLWAERRDAFLALTIFFVFLAAKSEIWFALAFLNKGSREIYLGVATRTMLYTLGWVLYFHNSKRVKNTYGRNL